MNRDNRVCFVLQGLALHGGSRLEILTVIMSEDSRSLLPGIASGCPLYILP